MLTGGTFCIISSRNSPYCEHFPEFAALASGRTSLLADGKNAQGSAAVCQADHLAWAKTLLAAQNSSWGKISNPGCSG